MDNFFIQHLIIKLPIKRKVQKTTKKQQIRQYNKKTVTKQFKVIHMGIDDYIPFCEIFVVPYMLWFAYIAVTVLFLEDLRLV